VKSATQNLFDKAYYQRFYFDKKTSVVDPAHSERLGAFVCSYLQYLRLPVSRVLDMGCGIGLWRDMVHRHYPHARFHGVEFSEYLCQRFGWEHGSVVNYRPAQAAAYDLVICQGVLPYLSSSDLHIALRNLATLCDGALYLEAVTREDWDTGILDEALTDTRQYKHSAALYRRGLEPYFTEIGGGLWLSHKAELPLFALEHAAPG
jgi:predicted TPR repeat methyltransferase